MCQSTSHYSRWFIDAVHCIHSYCSHRTIRRKPFSGRDLKELFKGISVLQTSEPLTHSEKWQLKTLKENLALINIKPMPKKYWSVLLMGQLIIDCILFLIESYRDWAYRLCFGRGSCEKIYRLYQRMYCLKILLFSCLQKFFDLLDIN